MPIRYSLLAILDQGECYGYQLRLEFERRTGGSRSLNVGQVYATLDRLERDGLVSQRDASDTGHIYYRITQAGSAQSQAWFRTATSSGFPDELALKLALAQTLPGVDVAALISAQRDATVAASVQYRADLAAGDLSQQLIAEAQLFGAEAELRWLDHSESRLVDARPFPLEAKPPRRGRPIRD
ncbi:MAG: helix-turn-helix transcriptional regulator [Rhodoglobus sp.]